MRTLSRLYVPEPVERVRTRPCHRACCWTPFGHSLTAPRTCTCHPEEDNS